MAKDWGDEMRHSGLSVLTSSLAECVAEVMRCIDANGQASVAVDKDGGVKVRFYRISIKNDCGQKFNYDAFTTPAQIMDDLTGAAAIISTYGIDRIAVSSVEIPDMNLAKIAAKESALQVQERNVLESVPIAKAWPIHSIINEMARKFQTRPERNRVAQILTLLVDQGLLRRNSAGEYQRIRKGEDEPMKTAATVTQIKPAEAPATPERLPESSVMNSIAEVASEMRRESAHLAMAFAKFAARLDEIGVDAGQQTQVSAEEAAKFRQFKEFFKSL